MHHGRLQLVDQQFHPQLGNVVLHDEQHFVVVLRLTQRLLRRQQRIQMQIATIGDLPVQIGLDTGFKIALIVIHAGPSGGSKTDMVTAVTGLIP